MILMHLKKLQGPLAGSMPSKKQVLVNLAEVCPLQRQIKIEFAFKKGTVNAVVLGEFFLYPDKWPYAPFKNDWSSLMGQIHLKKMADFKHEQMGWKQPVVYDDGSDRKNADLMDASVPALDLRFAAGAGASLFTTPGIIGKILMGAIFPKTNLQIHIVTLKAGQDKAKVFSDSEEDAETENEKEAHHPESQHDPLMTFAAKADSTRPSDVNRDWTSPNLLETGAAGRQRAEVGPVYVRIVFYLIDKTTRRAYQPNSEEVGEIVNRVKRNVYDHDRETGQAKFIAPVAEMEVHQE